MNVDKNNDLTSLARAFLVPANANQRRYEALRAFIVDGLPGAQAAQKFGYTPGSFRVLVHEFRKDPARPFFREPAAGRPRQVESANPLHERIVLLRKQNLSVYDISRALGNEGISMTPVGVWGVLRRAGFHRLPRRLDDERPAGARPITADAADVRKLDLEPRSFPTRFGGLFLFLPALATLPLDTLVRAAGLPGSKAIPASCATRALLALKLFGSARHTHVMSAVLDEGLALFAGLNVIPKRSFLTEYSCRIRPDCHPRLMRLWFDEVSKLGLDRGVSFDLDFHTIPFHGEDALLEKHYVSKRSRRQKGILAFLAQDAQTRVFCYANADLRKADQNDEILAFVAFWKKRTGRVPEELIFDSKLTTHANLQRLNADGIDFITLRRRTPKLLRDIAARPVGAWRKIDLAGVSRAFKTPRILDERIRLAGYDGPLRQLTVADLGHEQPTLLLTNQLTRSPARLIERYARRMLIENNIEDGVDFFHMDALSSAVALKVNCDLQLTLMASSLYRLLAVRIGNGYETAKSRHLFRDFIDASATVRIDEQHIAIRFQKRAHNPLLLAARMDQTNVPIPWLGNKRLRLEFG